MRSVVRVSIRARRRSGHDRFSRDLYIHVVCYRTWPQFRSRSPNDVWLTRSPSIVNLGCQLEGTTSAKCSGYSSYRSGYSNGWITGPTEIEWTKTLTGSDVEWGVLTMGEKPTHTDDYLDINESDITQPTTKSPDDRAMPAETGSAAGRSAMREKDWMMCTILMTAILTAVVL